MPVIISNHANIIKLHFMMGKTNAQIQEHQPVLNYNDSKHSVCCRAKMQIQGQGVFT